jgi:hypothetical protein
MAATVVTVTSALQVVAQIVPLIQAAIASGSETVDPVEFAKAVGDRNAGLNKLDADIAKAKTEGR